MNMEVAFWVYDTSQTINISKLFFIEFTEVNWFSKLFFFCIPDSHPISNSHLFTGLTTSSLTTSFRIRSGKGTGILGRFTMVSVSLPYACCCSECPFHSSQGLVSKKNAGLFFYNWIWLTIWTMSFWWLKLNLM